LSKQKFMDSETPLLLWSLACVLLIGFALWGLSRMRTVRDNHVAVIEYEIDSSLRFVASRIYWLSLFEQEIGQLDISPKEGELRLTAFTYSGINVIIPVKYRYQLDPRRMKREDLIAILQKHKESAFSNADPRQFSRILKDVTQKVVGELKPAHSRPRPETTNIHELLSPFKGASEAQFRLRFAQHAKLAFPKEGILINAITLDEPILPEEIAAAHQDRISAHFVSESQKNSIERLRQAVPDLPTDRFVQLVQDVHNPPEKVVYLPGRPHQADLNLTQTDPPASPQPPAPNTAPDPDLPAEAPYTFDLPLTDTIMATLK
jgi:hypothetical protein